VIGVTVSGAEQWREFRGPASSGISASAHPPVEFGPSRNVIWKTELPAGKSSPVFAEDRIFLTGHEGNKLITLCLDRQSGRVRWRKEVTRARAERRHKLNDSAAPAPVTGGENVYAFFADFGVLSYSKEGEERWRMPLPPMPSMQGVAASPLLAGRRLILVLDQAADSYMIALDVRNGETQWRKPRSPAPGGPLEFVTFSPFEIAGFSVETGEKLWWVGGLPPQPKSTPLVAGGVIYSYSRSFFGDSLPAIPDFPAVLEQNDRNKDGVLSKEEAPEGPARTYFGIVDHNKDGALDAKEWEEMREVAAPKSVVVAIKPEGRGDLTAKAVLWRFFRNVPDVPMPLLYRGSLYVLQNGGILSALDPQTGVVRKQGRLTGALGDYYASPVAADGKIFAANQEGKIAVISADESWELAGVNDLGEECFATPAIVDGDLFVRTASALYRFGQR
jgi:outer membrane protein assembly factor BamB